MPARSEFDFTMMSTFALCPKKYYYRIERGLVGKVPPVAAEFGKSIHLALDEWYKSRDIEKAVEVFRSVFVEQPDDDKRTLAMGEWILRNYAEKYANQPWHLVASELVFDLEFSPTARFIGRIDKIVRWSNTLWTVDHKTTSGMGPQFIKTAEPNGQFIGYVWASRKLGYDVVGLILDGMLVAKGLLDSKRRASLTPLLRYDAYMSDEILDAWAQEALEIQYQISVCEERNVWTCYGKFNGACTYYGECPYRKLCKEDTGVAERLIKSEYDVSFWSPKGEAADET